MTGNVWEWCWDKRDVEDPEISAQRVTRGGGFSYDAPKSKSTYRGIGKPNVGLYIFGFRIARSIVN